MKTLALSLILVSWAGVSNASPARESCSWNPRSEKFVCVHQAPEIDMSSVVAGFTLFLGALAVLRGRRVKGHPI